MSLKESQKRTADNTARISCDERDGNGIAKTAYARLRKVYGCYVKYRFARTVYNGRASADVSVGAVVFIYTVEYGKGTRTRYRA